MLKRMLFLPLLSGILTAIPVWGLEENRGELGQRLFESTALGATGKSCASCHPGGKGLQETGSYDDGQLREMINFCIRDALKGKPLTTGSQELEALYAYVRSLAAGRK
ncbi:MAG: hypothetical protein A2005_04325 [Desulfuromonadales bacterium GWC2_61_20]|nr:MAG: hypothetical protein A2005_04325 [Desulfuromonadales bacterium GWC2_61_20]HAD03274.1 cytochrome C [Desulfuromonas sp.]